MWMSTFTKHIVPERKCVGNFNVLLIDEKFDSKQGCVVAVIISPLKL